MLTTIRCFLESSAGFRGLSSVFRSLKKHISFLAAPAYTTIRHWILKIGLYKLNQPKNSSQGWFFIIDTSVQRGLEKCVLVLGIAPQNLTNNFCPRFDQAEVLALKVVKSSPGEMIAEILEEASLKVKEKPIAIISDEGCELKKGIRLYLEKNDEVIHLKDVSHKINNCLKHELKDDLIWDSFKKAAGHSVQRLKLSPLAHLSPPRQRTKERMHNALPLVEWGARLFNYLKSEVVSFEHKDKISWIQEYQVSFSTYKSLMEISKKALSLVHEKGYYRNIENDFVSLTEELWLDERSFNYRQKVAKILREEGSKVPDGQCYLGSSEVLESLFGKFKKMENHHSSSGLTSLVLAMPAVVGEINETEIYNAMKSVSAPKLKTWIERNMGSTFLSKRRQDLCNSLKSRINEKDLEPCDFVEINMSKI